MATPTAVLFDFDGVIADTENLHIAAWERTFAAMGREVSAERCKTAVELDDRRFLEAIFDEWDVEEADVDGWLERKQDLTSALLDDAPRLHRGVKELVERLRGRVTLGVVSTSRRRDIEAVLAATGLRDAFELIVGKEDVERPKPDPDPYLKALERLGPPASEAVALEDSPTGLAAAQAAGVRAIAVGHGRGPGPWAGDAPFLPNLEATETVLNVLDGSGTD